MNLILITKQFGKNFTGANLVTYNLIIESRTRFENIYIYTTKVGNHDSLPGIFILNLFSYKTYKNFKKNHTSNDTYYSDDHFGFLFKLFDKKYFHTYHGNWPLAKYLNINFFVKSFFFIPLYSLTLKYALKVINVSFFMNKFTQKFNKNSIVIRNGIKKSSEYDLNFHYNTCLMVGNFDRRKYGDLMLILKEFSRKNIPFTFHIYGKIIDKKLQRKFKNNGRVIFKGFTKIIPYKNYPFLLSLSKVENLPLSIIESIRDSIPVIAYDVGGISEVIDSSNGFLVKQSDYKTIISNILLLNKNPKMMSNFPEEFNYEFMIRSYLDLFKEDL
jgi:glycosyltransferase involved in cell wall biosynthesis